MKEGFK